MTTKALTRKSAHSPFRTRSKADEVSKRSKKFDKEYFTEDNYKYEEWHQDQGRAIVSKVCSAIHPKSDWVFLDVGCALGGVVEALRRREYEAYGVDVSRWCLTNSAVKKYLRFGSVTSLPCKAQSIDVSICIDTLQYLTQDEVKKAARELRRVTRKYLCLESITWEDEKFADPEENPDTLRKHRSLFARNDLILVFESAGFKLKQRRFLPRNIRGGPINKIGDSYEYYDYNFSFNAIFEPV